MERLRRRRNGLWLRSSDRSRYSGVVHGHRSHRKLRRATSGRDTIAVSSDPEKVEVGDDGTLFYARNDQWGGIRRVDPTDGNDTELSINVYEADLELSSDGLFLFVGESGTSGAATLDPPAAAAALTHQDHELWWFSEGTRAGRMHIVNVEDFLGN